MTFVKKKLLCALLVMLAAVLALGVALADQEITLSEIGARMSIPDTYVVLTKENLGEHEEFLARIGKSREVVEADWAERGVLLQAWWADKLDACMEVRAVQDDDAKAYFDLDQQPKSMRNDFKLSHLKGNKYKDLGYSIKSAEWKKQTLGGNFLAIKYKRTLEDGKVYWGYARKTVRNGYTITLDYQVYDRGVFKYDEDRLNKMANRVEFLTSGDVPATATGTSLLPEGSNPDQTGVLVQYTAVPPAETDTGEFMVEGTCLPECHLIGVVMRMATTATPYLFETDAGKNGKFKLKVTLPEEGTWLMTLTVEKGDQTIAEQAFDVTNYSKTLIPVTMERDIPEALSGNETVLSGTTIRNVTVQCIVTNGTMTYDKTVKTNGTGKFKFEIPTELQADYDMTLVFSKKNYDTRRITGTAKRELTQADIDARNRSNAVKPNYATLVKKLDVYTGKVLNYKVFIVSTEQNGDEWIITAALRKNGKTYKDFIYIITQEDPGFEEGSQHKMYGTCIGNYQIQSEETNDGYPSVDLLFWDD